MLDKEQFTKWVFKYFGYVIADYQFQYIGFNAAGRDDIFCFTKPGLILEVKYNYPNKYFDINLYKITNTERPYYWDNIDLNWMVIKYEGLGSNHIYEKPLPDIEQTISYKAALLKNYGDRLLSGAEWYSWKDISGWKKGTMAIATLEFREDARPKSSFQQIFLQFIKNILKG